MAAHNGCELSSPALFEIRFGTIPLVCKSVQVSQCMGKVTPACAASILAFLGSHLERWIVEWFVECDRKLYGRHLIRGSLWPGVVSDPLCAFANKQNFGRTVLRFSSRGLLLVSYTKRDRKLVEICGFWKRWILKWERCEEVIEGYRSETKKTNAGK